MTGFVFESEHHQGPLEALLDLIESRKLSVSLVSLSEVCDSYLAYVEKLPELPIAETSQFILVASTLLLIKSRTLLPTVDLSTEESQSIEELERRLARYAAIRKAARLLKDQWGTRQLFFQRRRPAPEYTGGKESAFNPGESSTSTIHAAIQKLISVLPKPEKVAEAVVAPVLALEDVIAHVRNKLATGFRARWSELTKSANRHDAIVHFLAILELVRHGSISATQDKIFSDIVLESDAIGIPKY